MLQTVQGVVRERRDVTESARGKGFGGERRDITDSARGRVRWGKTMLKSMQAVKGSVGRDVMLQRVQGGMVS